MVVFPVCARGGRRLVARPLRPAVPIRKRIEFATSWPRVREQQKPGVNSRWLRSQESFLSGFSDEKTKMKKQKRIPFFKNEPEKLLKTKGRASKANRTEPENEAEKLLKTHTCGKNEPESEPGHVVGNKEQRKNETKTHRSKFWQFARPS